MLLEPFDNGLCCRKIICVGLEELSATRSAVPCLLLYRRDDNVRLGCLFLQQSKIAMRTDDGRDSELFNNLALFLSSNESANAEIILVVVVEETCKDTASDIAYDCDL